MSGMPDRQSKIVPHLGLRIDDELTEPASPLLSFWKFHMACNLMESEQKAPSDGVKEIRDGTMAIEQSVLRSAASVGRSRDFHVKLYRKIGISAVVAALEATKPMQKGKDVSAVLTGDRAA